MLKAVKHEIPPSGSSVGVECVARFSASYIVSIIRDSFRWVPDGQDFVSELCQYAIFAHSSASDTVYIFSDPCTLVLDNGDIVSFPKRCKSFSF